MVRDWFPLAPASSHDARASASSYSWMIYTQAKLRFHLTQLDSPAEEFPYLPNTTYNTILGPTASSNTNSATATADMATMSNNIAGLSIR